MPTPRFSLVIPTYNESENIAALLQQLDGLLTQQIPGGYEFVLVDDDSPDQTWKLAEEIAASQPALPLRVLRRVDERGLATAVVAGWKAAQGEWLGVIDADLQHPPGVLEGLLQAMNEGADLAVASRHTSGGGVGDWSLFRRMLSRGAQLIGILLLPAATRAVSDPMSGCFIVKREAVPMEELRPLGYKILLEILARGQFGKIVEVPYVFQERKQGGSKVTWRLYLDYLVQLWRLRGAAKSKKP